MSESGDFPKLAARCGQCGAPYWARACGPTHAMVWQGIGAPVRAARRAERIKLLDLIHRAEQLRQLAFGAAPRGPEA